MVETTETMTVQLTFIETGELRLDEKQLEEWIKKTLGADDVKVSNLRRFEMEK